MAKKPSLWKWGAIGKRQRMVMSWWIPGKRYADADGIICDGSIRSGKTISMGFSFVLWAMTTFDGKNKPDNQNFAMCGKTIQSFRRNVLGNLKRQLGAEGFSVSERRSENMIVISKGKTTNIFYLFGGKDEGSQDLIQGITLAGVLFDEVALMPESFINQATGRCSVDGSKFWFNCNPAGPEHWFYKDWIMRHKQKNLVYLHFTMKDNMTLTPKIRKRYESQYHGVFYQRYILGLWVMAEGLIFDMFDKKKHVLKEEPRTEGDYIISSDFGIQNDNVFLLWRRIAGTTNWYCEDECRWQGREKKRQKTVSELVDDLEIMLHGRKPSIVILDPSAAAMKAELKKRGYKVKGANNDVLDGIADVGTMLYNGQLLFSKKCKGTITEFGLYCWDEKAAERGEDKPIKTNDHGMDAVRYFVRTMKLVKREGNV